MACRHEGQFPDDAKWGRKTHLESLDVDSDDLIFVRALRSVVVTLRRGGVRIDELKHGFDFLNENIGALQRGRVSAITIQMGRDAYLIKEVDIGEQGGHRGSFLDLNDSQFLLLLAYRYLVSLI